MILLKREKDELGLNTQPLRFFGSSNRTLSTINEKTLQSRRGEKTSAKVGRRFAICRDSALTETWIMSCFSGITGTRGWSPPSKASHHGRVVDFVGRNQGTLPGAEPGATEMQRKIMSQICGADTSARFFQGEMVCNM